MLGGPAYLGHAPQILQISKTSCAVALATTSTLGLQD